MAPGEELISQDSDVYVCKMEQVWRSDFTLIDGTFYPDR